MLLAFLLWVSVRASAREGAANRGGLSPLVQAFLGPGVLGSFTTFSGVVVVGSAWEQDLLGTPTLFLGLLSAGAAGAAIRGWATGRAREPHLGTRAVNLAGALGAGIMVGWAGSGLGAVGGAPPGPLMGSGPDPALLAVLALGFFGSLTTFSTWVVEGVRLLPSRWSQPGAPPLRTRLAPSVSHLIGVLLAGFLLAAIGTQVGRMVRGLGVN